MAGLIKREDIEEVLARVRVEDVVGSYVTLKPAGVGSLKGLCPFHDEKTPSFHVRPHYRMWHCFGCSEGGDVIKFLQKIENLPFVEAVETLAKQVGVELHYEAGEGPSRQETSLRQRLLDAHRVADEFYQEQMVSPQAQAAREFLANRGFDPQAANYFGIGYSPAGWDELVRHLVAKGFSQDELRQSGLVTQGKRGIIDRFRGRLMWPIRSLTGQTIGFGARKLDPEDQGPKYLNTPETVIYKKSQVLYGLDLARRDIIGKKRVVVVEGYTDVMAAHLAGETTAVASCGTAFGANHIQILRRLIGDAADPAKGVILPSGQARGGEVIFTFDGDAAGQKAAIRAFSEDQRFAAQTFVAILPDGLDPCDLRIKRGDAALQRAINERRPLFEFAMRTTLQQCDLSTAEGRVQGLRALAPMVASIRDHALRSEYCRQVSMWLALEVETVVKEVSKRVGAHPRVNRNDKQMRAELTRLLSDPVSALELQVIMAYLQFPQVAAENGLAILDAQMFSSPSLRAVVDAIRAAGSVPRWNEFYQAAITNQEETESGASGSGSVGADLQQQAMEQANNLWIKVICDEVIDSLQSLITHLVLQDLPITDAPSGPKWAAGVVRSFLKLSLTRQIGDLRAQLQMTSPDLPAYEELFSTILSLENQRRQLQEN